MSKSVNDAKSGPEFTQGQRWVVDSEPELGLGIVVAVEPRTVSIFFPLGDCERQYALHQPPLTRIAFHIEETITDSAGQTYIVQNVNEQEGLLIYEVEGGDLIIETQLSPEIQLNQPFMRLMMGQLDRRRWFYFRRSLDAAMARVWGSRLNGLLGVRASLIPHQLYVANSACEREQVRVLLSDEVGLGKTIEAGMILNRLLKLERIERAIIAVPAALQVQWLVELIRRFGLTPVIYDEVEHDYSHGQIHIVPHDVIESELDAILAAEFDIAIVDEAHHIHHDEPIFEALRAISALCEHLVLMTATPEQLGFDSHFARLQLLDPAKYQSAEALRDEEHGYEALNDLIRKLPGTKNELISRYELELDNADDEQALINQLLDCHGVGRVVFRNARSSVAGFPERIAIKHELEDAEWETRFEWLAQFLKKHSEDKVLVITHHKDQVLDCEAHLWQKHGIDAAVFHEDLNLIERDRAAAYFADMEQGARVLLCSEIGSEGRNFQFSHRLVCMDLPDHPDLLEQRIGRLDRIGQKHDVDIHGLVSTADDSAARWQWFDETLDCIAQQNPAAGTVHDELWPGDYAQIDAALASKAKEKVSQLAEQIRDGRDALLEMNSCREPQASELAERIADFEYDSPQALVEQAANLLNFHFEDLGSGRFSLIPADNMLIDALPGIPPEGIELTFDRSIANAREDLIFMTWDSAFITGLWELLHHSEIGSACVAMLPSRQLPPGKCLLETCFDVVIQSEFSSECLPFMSNYSVRAIATDLSDKDLAPLLSEEQLQNTLQKVDKKLARQIVKSQKDALPLWYDKAEKFAEMAKANLISESVERVRTYFSAEKSRLNFLAQKNPAVDVGELEVLEKKEQALVTALQDQSRIQLSAIRMIVTNKP